jgi:hypothetical protein
MFTTSGYWILFVGRADGTGRVTEGVELAPVGVRVLVPDVADVVDAVGEHAIDRRAWSVRVVRGGLPVTGEHVALPLGLRVEVQALDRVLPHALDAVVLQHLHELPLRLLRDHAVQVGAVALLLLAVLGDPLLQGVLVLELRQELAVREHLRQLVTGARDGGCGHVLLLMIPSRWTTLGW